MIIAPPHQLYPTNIGDMHLILPEDPAPLRKAFDDNDIEGAYRTALNCSTRPFVFSLETLSGVVIYETATGARNAPIKASLHAEYFLGQRNDAAADAPETVGGCGADVGGSVGESTTAVILDRLIEGTVQGPDGKTLHVIAWMFSNVVCMAADAGATLRLRVSAEPNRESLAKDAGKQGDHGGVANLGRVSRGDGAITPSSGVAMADTDSTETIKDEGPKTQIMTPPQKTKSRNDADTSEKGSVDSGVDQTKHVSLETAVFPPLLLSLNTSGVGSCAPEYATLRITPPRIPYPWKDDLQVTILSVSAASKNGDVSLVGKLAFPALCSIGDTLNATYKLQVCEGPEFAHPAVQKMAKCSVLPSNPNLVQLGPSDETRHTRLTFKVAVRFDTLNFPEKRPLTSVLNVSWSPLIDTRPKSALNRKAAAPSTNVSWSKLASQSNTVISSAKIPANASLSSINLPKTGAYLKHKPFRSLTLIPGVALTGTVNIALPATSALSGLRLSFTGNVCVALGVVETWKVQVINTGNRALELHMTSNRLRRNVTLYSQANNSRMAAFNQKGASNVKMSDSDARGVRFNDKYTLYTQAQLYHQYQALKPARDGVVALTPELSLGLLGPSQVYETDFEFIGFVKGNHSLEGLSLFDAGSKEGFDIGRWLEVFVV